MLPDFPRVKTYAHGLLARGVRQEVLRQAPLLQEIPHSRIHEGRAAFLTRADASTDKIQVHQSTAAAEIAREQMRRVTQEQLMQLVVRLAEQFAEQQMRTLLERVSQAADAVGNTVSGATLGAKEAFLEAERRIQMDFDPETLEPKNLVLVMHPSEAERLKVLVEEWERDPDFRAAQQEIRRQKIEEWRARENRRQLVD